MSRSYTNIIVHLLLGTKHKRNYIQPQIEKQLYEFITEQLIQQGCRVKIINGVADHVHCLFVLNPQKALCDVVKQVKGSSSYFINRSNLMNTQFKWQREYGAFSVSKSASNIVFNYIKKQKTHHTKKSYEDEFDFFTHLHHGPP